MPFGVLVTRFDNQVASLRGVIDSADLPLNVSRELLQESRDVRAIREGFESSQEFFNVHANSADRVGGQGIVVGGSRLVQTLDYGDTFTLGAGARLMRLRMTKWAAKM